MAPAELLTAIEESDEGVSLRIPAGRTRRNFVVMASIMTLFMCPLFSLAGISLTMKGCGIVVLALMMIALRWYYQPRSRQTVTISQKEILIESPNTEVYPPRILATSKIENVYLREPPSASATRAQAFAALQHYDPYYGIVVETEGENIVLGGHLKTYEQQYLCSFIQEKLNLSA